jgi:hypothetical protein
MKVCSAIVPTCCSRTRKSYSSMTCSKCGDLVYRVLSPYLKKYGIVCFDCKKKRKREYWFNPKSLPLALAVEKPSQA